MRAIWLGLTLAGVIVTGTLAPRKEKVYANDVEGSFKEITGALMSGFRTGGDCKDFRPLKDELARCVLLPVTKLQNSSGENQQTIFAGQNVKRTLDWNVTQLGLAASPWQSSGYSSIKVVTYQLKNHQRQEIDVSHVQSLKGGAPDELRFSIYAPGQSKLMLGAP